MFKKLSDELNKKFFRKDDLAKQLEIIRVFDIYKKAIKNLLPRAKQISPISLKNRILTVQTPGSVAANELRFHERQVLEKINAAFERPVLRRIIYRF